MASALGSRPRGRGRGAGGRLPVGNLPRGGAMPGTGPARNVLGQGSGSPFSGAPRHPQAGANGNAANGGPGIGNARPARGRGRQPGQGSNGAPGAGGKGGPKGGIGEQALPGPGGRQLEARVQSGKITQAQAEQTMKQRQTLKAAFGDDWRDQLAVGGKSFAQIRKGLAKDPGNAKLAALNKKLLANRKTALDAARKKLAGGGEEEGAEEGGKKKRRGGEGQE